MRGTHPERAIERAVVLAGTIRRAERLLIACSGGADSVALAAIAAAIAKSMRLTLTIGHVNHGLRASAWQDEAVVLRAGAALGIPVKIAAITPARSDEATLREARYAALAQMARQTGSTAVATGHHAGDQTETVLLALFRGTGPVGIAGMPARRELEPGIDLLRPLLPFAREDLREYVQRSGLPYAIDPSNDDRRLRRNAIRALIEELRPLFPGLDAAVSRAAGLVAGELGATERAALRRQVRSTLREHQGLRDVDFAHIEAAARALASGSSGRFAVGGGVEIAIERGAMTVEKR